MEYIELLRDPRWQKNRLKIFERDDWTCTKCSDTMTTLAIHHLYYTPNTMPWEYPDSALVTVCELCHDKYEFLQWLMNKGVPMLKPDFLLDDLTEINNLIERRVWQNHHSESVYKYMTDIRMLCYG